MLLSFLPRVIVVLHLNVQAHPLAVFRYDTREVIHGELFRELVEYAHLPWLCWITDRELNAAHSVPDVKEAACLPTLAVHSERVADRCLHTETVQRSAKDVVIVETVVKHGVHARLVGVGAVHNALVEVGGTEVPHFASELHVVRVVHLRQMIEGAGLLGVREGVGAAVVLDGDVAFFDVDVGGAVLAHGAKFDEVAVGGVLGNSVEDVEGANDVVVLGEDGALAVQHGVRRAALLAEVDGGVGEEVGPGGGEELVVGHVAGVESD